MSLPSSKVALIVIEFTPEIAEEIERLNAGSEVWARLKKLAGIPDGTLVAGLSIKRVDDADDD